MFELLMKVCLLADPSRCHSATLNFEDAGQSATPYGCMIAGQAEMAKWKAEHPNFSIEKWRCGVAGLEAKL